MRKQKLKPNDPYYEPWQRYKRLCNRSFLLTLLFFWGGGIFSLWLLEFVMSALKLTSPDWLKPVCMIPSIVGQLLLVSPQSDGNARVVIDRSMALSGSTMDLLGDVSIVVCQNGHLAIPTIIPCEIQPNHANRPASLRSQVIKTFRALKMNKKSKAQITAIMLLMLTPSVAYAHGEQIILLLVPDAFWIVFVVVVLPFWEESRKNKAILTTAIILGIVLAWFLPFNWMDYLDHMPRYIALKAGVPLATGAIAYLAIRTGKRRKL